MQDVLGFAAALSMVPLYCAYLNKIRKCWISNARHDHSETVAATVVANNFAWTAWSLVAQPTDWYRFWSTLPALAISTFILLQCWTGRPPLLRILGALAVPYCYLVLFSVLFYRPSGGFDATRQIAASCGTACTIALAIVGAPAQWIKNLRIMAEQRAPNVSLFVFGAVSLSYLMWTIYGVSRVDLFQIISQGCGSALWGAVFFQSLYGRIRYPDSPAAACSGSYDAESLAQP